MMVRVHGFILCGLLVLATVSSMGCSHVNSGLGTLYHELKPHRLWRWNRQTQHSGDRYFSSISDPIPAVRADTLADADR